MKSKLLRVNFKDFIPILDGKKTYRMFEHTEESFHMDMTNPHSDNSSAFTDLNKSRMFNN